MQFGDSKAGMAIQAFQQLEKKLLSVQPVWRTRVT